ncbi:hypothetical protein, partial [Parasutterella sp.]|uniref:hypothetical protein n=1 Tax=Parasutterella sp. TaxID=2049037 RepID=UPI003AB6A281
SSRITVSIGEEIDGLGPNQLLLNGKFRPDPLKIKSLKAIGKNQAFYRTSLIFPLHIPNGGWA